MKQRLHSLYQRFLAFSLFKKVGVITIIMVILGFAWMKLFGQKTATPQYQTATVERGTLISNVSSSGTVASGNTASIATSATGTVTAVYVKNGDSVVQGEKIADITLDQESQQKQAAAYASYLGAQNSLNSAKAKMNSLQSSLFKANQAFMTDKGAGNPGDAEKADPKYIQENADWLQAEADYTNQSGVIAQAEASLTSASLSYAQLSSSIYAPATGTIANVTLSSGTPITSTQSTSSNTNTSTSQSIGSIAIAGGLLQAKVNLSEIDVTKVAVDQKVTMTLDAFSGKTYTGKVTAIDTTGSVSSGVTTYPATITFDSNESHIYPNMAVSAQIITLVKDDVLLVPSTAVTTTNGTTTVQVMKNGKPTAVTVTIGDSSDTQTEITSGLNEGDTIVTSTINTTSTTTNSSTTSPFGGTSIGGLRSGAAGFSSGTGNAIRIRGN